MQPKTKPKKICVNNKLTRSVQILDYYLYNKLRADNLNRILAQIRSGKISKHYIFVYAYTFTHKQGRCGVITSEHFTKEQFNDFVIKMNAKYKNLRISSLKGELLL